MLAERRYAIERAVEETDLSLAMLRLFSIGAFAPEKPSLIVALGREGAEREMTIVIEEGVDFTSEEGLVHADALRPMILDHEFLRRTIIPALTPWSALLLKDNKTEFENEVPKSALVYSRATRSRNISEKLLHIFAASEALLLRNESEPISRAISERIAFIAGKNTDERIAIARNELAVYGVRSRYVHHALEIEPTTEELAALELFLVSVSAFFNKVAIVAPEFATREMFISSLERRKFE